MQGKSIMLQKSLVRTMGIEPDAIYDPATGKSTPIDAYMTQPAQVFVNQGVPMTEGVYSPPMIGPSAIESIAEGGVQFNAPKTRSESNNAPFPGKHGDPFAGMGGM
jgi:hypothetical protein